LEKVIMEENSRDRDFVIAEVLACVTFVLNTICVVTGKMKSGEMMPVWLPDFGLVYWLKTVLAIIGLVYLFRSKIIHPLYIFILTLVVLLYSIPVINSFLTFPFDYILSGNIMLQGIDYDVNIADKKMFDARVYTQIAWSLPVLIIVANLFMKLISRTIKKSRTVSL